MSLRGRGLCCVCGVWGGGNGVNNGFAKSVLSSLRRPRNDRQIMTPNLEFEPLETTYNWKDPTELKGISFEGSADFSPQYKQKSGLKSALLLINKFLYCPLVTDLRSSFLFHLSSLFLRYNRRA